MENIKVGDKAPDFTLKDSENNDFTLSSLFGKQSIILYFYPSSFTSGCTAESCAFRDNWDNIKKISNDSTTIVGVSVDPVEIQSRFKKEYDLPFPILSDPQEEASKKYGVGRALLGLSRGRKTFVIDKEGVIRHVYEGALLATKHVNEAINAIKKIEGK